MKSKHNNAIFPTQSTLKNDVLLNRLEKYALNKYYYKISFLQTANPESLAEIWDEKFAFFLNDWG